MNSNEAAALAAIRSQYGELVDYYETVGDDPIIDLPVIWSDEAGAPFEGPGNTTRTVTAEIDQSTIPARPTRATRIVRQAVAWTVIEVVDRDDVGAWVVTLEAEPL